MQSRHLLNPFAKEKLRTNYQNNVYNTLGFYPRTP